MGRFFCHLRTLRQKLARLRQSLARQWMTKDYYQRVLQQALG
jgi:hypothetical protein